MRSLTNILVTAAALAVSTLCPAQSIPRPLWVNIPFAFTAQHTKLPAGRYCLRYDDTRDTWQLRTFGHTEVEFRGRWQALKHEAGDDAVLFEHDGDTYRLQGVREAGLRKVAQFTGAGSRPQPQVASAERGTDLLKLLGLRHSAADENRQ